MPTGSLGLEGIVSKPGVAVQVRPLARLAQVQEPGRAGCETGGGGRLEMDAVTRIAREGVRETRVIWGR